MYQAVFDDQPVRTITDKKAKIQRYYYLDMKKCLDDNEDRIEAVLSIPSRSKTKRKL